MTELVVLLVLLIFSGIFSGSETALVALSIGRVEALVKERRHGARSLHQLKRDPSQMLTTILIGNNVVNIAASVMAAVIATRLFGDMGPGIAVGALTIAILIFGEITPKSLATRYSERISLAIAPPMLAFMKIIFPFVWLLGKFTTWVHRLVGAQRDPTVTESELISMLGHGEEEGTIHHGKREIIERVFSFHNLKVRDVMTPLGDVFSLNGAMSVSQALPLVSEVTYTRIPLCDDDRDNLYKVIYLRDLLTAVADRRGEARLDEVSHEPIFVPQYQNIDELFGKLLHQRRHLAIVVDEFGTIRGIVTLEDLLEELVGEIYDESDLAPQLGTRISEHELSVEGAAELRVVEDFFDIDLPGKPTDTVGFWILNTTASIPEADTTYTIDGLEVQIAEASRRRIDRVRVRRPSSASVHSPKTDNSH